MAVLSDPQPGLAASDLGFRWTVRKDGAAAVTREGVTVSVLRGALAQAFLAGPALATPSQAQQALARITSNYRRGNERAAGAHRRNRG